MPFGAGFQTGVYKRFKKSERKLTFDFFLHSHSVSRSNQKYFVPSRLCVSIPLRPCSFASFARNKKTSCLCAFVPPCFKSFAPLCFNSLHLSGERGIQFKIHRSWLWIEIISARFYKTMLSI